MSNTPITKEQAITTAVGVGEKSYGQLTEFEISVDEEVGRWVVGFTNPHALADGDGQHFAVWIDKITGVTQLFKGR